ncbi:MAG: GGDEF domain-containing protein [Ruminiclostridium sp.]
MYNGHRIISLCISKASSERNFEFIQALNQAVISYNYRLFIYHTCSDLYWKTKCEEGDKAVFELIDYSVTDALIIFDEAFHDKDFADKIVDGALHNGIPVISVGAVREGCISFMFDYEKGFEQIVRHIIEFHGIKNTCFIAGQKGEACSEQRIAVYKKVLSDNNIDFSGSRLFYGDYWWWPTQCAVEQIIDSGDIPRAVICANDMMAITVCEIFRKHGYRVPEDIAVTGFDGTREAISCNPPLTTCKCSFDNASEKIVGVLERVFSGKPTDKLNLIDFSPIIYSSCGCGGKSTGINFGEMLKKTEDRFVHYQDDERSLYELTEIITSCKTVGDFSERLGQFNFYGTCIVLNKDCFDGSVNPAQYSRSATFDEEMTVVYSSDKNADNIPCSIKRSSITPDFPYLLEQPNPLVFSSLSYLGYPMGYVCFSFNTDPDNYCKIHQFVTALNNTIGSYRSVKYPEYLSSHDFLTGMYNRSGFYRELPHLISRAGNNDKILVASVDANGLKRINDKFGHDSGDFAIKSVAGAIASLPLENKICGRFGGDEFVICAVSSEETADEKIKQHILDSISELNRTANKEFSISASVGVFTSEPDNFDFSYALKQSDDLMYIMKIGHPDRRKN